VGSDSGAGSDIDADTVDPLRLRAGGAQMARLPTRVPFPRPVSALRPVSITLAAAAALGMGGCGTAMVSPKSFSGPGRAVAQTVADLQSAAQGHDGKRICRDLLSSAVVTKLNVASGGCPSVISRQLNEVDSYDLSLANGQSISLSGDRATAHVTSTSRGKTHTDTLNLVLEGGRWKVSALSG